MGDTLTREELVARETVWRLGGGTKTMCFSCLRDLEPGRGQLRAFGVRCDWNTLGALYHPEKGRDRCRIMGSRCQGCIDGSRHLLPQARIFCYAHGGAAAWDNR